MILPFYFHFEDEAKISTLTWDISILVKILCILVIKYFPK